MAVGASLPFGILFDEYKVQHNAPGPVMTSGLVLIVLCGVRNIIHNKYII